MPIINLIYEYIRSQYPLHKCIAPAEQIEFNVMKNRLAETIQMQRFVRPNNHTISPKRILHYTIQCSGGKNTYRLLYQLYITTNGSREETGQRRMQCKRENKPYFMQMLTTF